MGAPRKLRRRRSRFYSYGSVGAGCTEVRPLLFPGYCFVFIELQWHAARWSSGTLGLIMAGDAPARVSDAVIAELRGRERDGLIELPKAPELSPGITSNHRWSVQRTPSVVRGPNIPRARRCPAAVSGRPASHRVAGECHRTEGGRVVTLPEAELSFYFAALAQLEPARRPAFTERVTRLLGAHPNPGPRDVDRAVRQALVACGRRRQLRNSRGPRAGIALPRRSSGFRSALGKLRCACELSVNSWGVVHELSIGDHVRN